MQIESAGCTFVRETESLGESWLRHPTSKPQIKAIHKVWGTVYGFYNGWNGNGCLHGSVHNLSIDPLIQTWSEWVWVFSSQTTDGLGIFHSEVFCFVAQITKFSWLKIPVTKKHHVKIVTPGLFIVYEISGGSPHDLVIFIHPPQLSQPGHPDCGCIGICILFAPAPCSLVGKIEAGNPVFVTLKNVRKPVDFPFIQFWKMWWCPNMELFEYGKWCGLHRFTKGWNGTHSIFRAM